MDFDKIRAGVKALKFETLRTDSDDYFEAVVIKEELERLSCSLKKFFGGLAWSSKNEIPAEMQEKINGFGGIMPGQTFYFRNEGSESIFAMLWPWQDGRRTTVKIVHK